MSSKLTEKQSRFVDAYIKTANATEAAKLAGYGGRRAVLGQIGAANLGKPSIRAAIDKRLKSMENKRIADAVEVMEFLTASMRGVIEEEMVLTVGTGEGKSAVRKVKKKLAAKDRLKAAELLAKRYGLSLPDDTSGDEKEVTIIDDAGET